MRAKFLGIGNGERMSGIELNLLGPVQVKIDGTEVILSGRKLRCILAILALRSGNEVRRDELIEELNLTSSTGNAVNTLHAHMTRLRRWLNSQPGDQTALLESTASGYRLRLQRSAIDAHRFVQQVEHAMKLPPSAPSVVATILEEALDSWRGDALVDVIDGPLASAAAGELHQIRTTARELLLDAWIRLGHDHRVVIHARRFIADDPLNERIRAQLITSLRRAGRHAEAAEAYKTSEEVLQSELGVLPGEGLRTAFTDLTQHEDDLRHYSERHLELPLYFSEF